MHTETRYVTNWGRYPTLLAELASPADTDEARAYLAACERLIARGNGRCYGDAALSPHIVSTLKMNHLRSFDPATGVVDCEAGLLLSDLLDTVVPLGWFPHVTPGTRFVSIGGCIASDVHGKNHPAKGCFSNWLISFELMRSDGSVLHCSRTENADLFWHTCGGMGWTGIILSAHFQLMRLPSAHIWQTTRRGQNLAEVFQILEENRDATYAAAWLDAATFSEKKLGRGVVFLGEHDGSTAFTPSGKRAFTPRDSSHDLRLDSHNIAVNGSFPDGVNAVLPAGSPPAQKYGKSFFKPSFLLNPLTIRLYNEFYFFKNRPSERLIGLYPYFYPLDRWLDWNLLYGPRGLVQYQFCLSEKISREGMARVLETVQRSPETPYLAVLKRHGDRPPEALRSFPMLGYSLALDFRRSPTLPRLVAQLDDLVWQLGGRIYLAKDAGSAARMGRIWPDAVRDEGKFWSLLRGRVTSPPAPLQKGEG